MASNSSSKKKLPKAAAAAAKRSGGSSNPMLLVEPCPNLLPSKSGDFLKLLTVVAIASSVAFFCNYFLNLLNRHPIPFCDTADFDHSLSDFCEPCPRNGVCHEGKFECSIGYRKIGKSCVEDGDINDLTTKLSTLVQDHVCEAYAQSLCEGTGKFWVQEADIWNKIDESKLMEQYGLDTNIYRHARQRAAQAVGEVLETGVSSKGTKELKCPDLLVNRYKPASCYIQHWIAEHALILVQVCAVLLGCILILVKIRRRHYLSSRAEELYNKVCDILEEKALMSGDVNCNGEPWVVVSWLRDHLLSPKERRDPLLWKKVEELVQEDSRLDRYPKIVKGESKVVWEWQVEGSLGSSEKRKKVMESKLKRSEGVTTASHQTPWTPKAGALFNF